LTLHYTGQQNENSLSNWIIFTVFAGLIPSIIKLLVLLLSHSKISSKNFYTELFFFSLVLLIDVIKNTSKKLIRWKISLILLSIYSATYGYILCGDLKLLRDNYIPSSNTILVCAFISIIAGIVLGLITVYTGGEQV